MVTANYPYKHNSSLQTKTNTVKYNMWQLFSSWLILILLAHKLCCTYDKNSSLCSEKKMIIYEHFFAPSANMQRVVKLEWFVICMLFFESVFLFYEYWIFIFRFCFCKNMYVTAGKKRREKELNILNLKIAWKVEYSSSTLILRP